MWLECPSTIRRRFYVRRASFVYRLNTVFSYTSPIALFDYPFWETVKYACAFVSTESTQVLIREPDSPLYIKSSRIHRPIAEMQAKQLINSRLLSCFDFVTLLDFNASKAITLFKERLKPIINPFSSKLYMFSAVILYFSITMAS